MCYNVSVMTLKTEISVEAFAPQGIEADKLLQYPFARPEGSFMTDGEAVVTLPSDYPTFCVEADNMLRSKAMPTIAERIPVVAYGANVSPAKFREKMDKYGDTAVQSELQTVPMLAVEIPDQQVVWHGKPSQAGSVFSELYKGEDTEGQSASAVVQFLTNEQLALMHATEGVTYHLAPVDVRTADDATIHAVAYVAGASSMLVEDGKPVAMKVSAEDTTAGMTAREAVSFMVEHAGAAVGAEIPEDLIALSAGKALSEKKANQAKVEEALRSQGLSKEFSHPAQADWYYGRADFNELSRVGHNPTTLHLAEESLARLRPTKEAIDEEAEQIAAETGVTADEARKKARTKLDIMTAIRNRHRAELQERLDQNPVDKIEKT